MEGKIFAVCISSKKGTKKEKVENAVLIADWGIKGDAHAGPGPRQVSLLALDEINRMKRIIPGLKPGDFAENIVIQDIDLNLVEAGDRIAIGTDVLLEVTQIGKECHSICEIQRQTGTCIMPEKGIFARVLKGGFVKIGQLVRLHKQNS